MTTLYEIPLIRSDGTETTLDAYRGQVILVVNTASECGFTPQLQGLEGLYRRYRDQGFVVLGFPCNQFGKQEPGTQAEIAEFCQVNYGVTFPIFRKIDVNGPGAAPLFDYLKEKAPGIMGSQKIKWNFTKFLISADGRQIRRFAPTTKPARLAADIERLLRERQQQAAS